MGEGEATGQRESWRPDPEIPLYRQLKDLFLASIEGGQWAPGALIPTEAELAAGFGVSKGPVRQALGQLVRAGLLERRQGRGTWVLPRPAEWSAISGMSIARLIAQQGQPHRVTVRRFARVAAPAGVASTLGCPVGTPVYRVEVVRCAGDLPVALETLYVPQHFLPQLRREELGERESIYRRLRDAGHHNTHSLETVQAMTLDQYAAAALGVPAGAPALLVSNRAFDRHGRVLVHSYVLLRGDRFRISIALPPRATSEPVVAELMAAGEAADAAGGVMAGAAGGQESR